MRPIIEFKNVESLRFFLENATVSVVYASTLAYASLVPEEIVQPLRMNMPRVRHAAAMVSDLQELSYVVDYREAIVFAKTRLIRRVAIEPSEHSDRMRFIFDKGFAQAYHATAVENILEGLQSIPSEPKDSGASTSLDDPFKVLGVKPTATLNEIRAAKRRLVQECHPDRVTGAGLGGRLWELAEAEMKRINRASDEAERRARLRAAGTSR